MEKCVSSCAHMADMRLTCERISQDVREVHVPSIRDEKQLFCIHMEHFIHQNMRPDMDTGLIGVRGLGH